ncbi:UNVERIFIED_CONTAM: hypothetical protein GTU68_005068 [Idotea baltica]|nr:hypothetical protein [Idotea baltica]
MFHLQLQM